MAELEQSEQQTETTDAESTSPPNLVFELHGSQFENRATDRATKKYKQKHMPDL